MSPTIIVYLFVLAVLGVATLWLLLRDMNASEEAKAERRQQLDRLPLSADEAPAEKTTDRIDQRFRHLIYQSGLDWTPEPAFLLMVLVGMALGGGVLVWQNNIVFGAAAFLVGMALPLAAYVLVRRARINKIREQLPEALDLMSRSVRAGESVDQAVEAVGRNTNEPLGVEFKRAARQLDMGLSLSAALRSLNRRAPLVEVRILGTALNVQRQTGGNLPLTLDRLAGVIRDRMSYQRQFMAATGASRMGTILIASAGPVVFAYMMIFQPAYIRQFFTLPGGWALLSTAVVLQVVGLVWVAGLLRNNY